jgi:CMP-2-keto-3-deoxyoctulosonic acid synthetase
LIKIILLYIFRLIIPYPREENGCVRHAAYWDLCFRKTSIIRLYSLPDVIGGIRKLEQLRYLEFKRIKMIETTHIGIGTYPEDLEKKQG